MAAVDIVIVFILCIFIIKGAVRGFINEALTIAAIILSIIFLPKTSNISAKIINYFGFNQSYTDILILITGFFITYFIIIIIGKIFSRFIHAVSLGWINIIAGILFGLFKGAFVVSAILWGIKLIMPSDAPFMADIYGAKSAKMFFEVLPYCIDKLGVHIDFNNISSSGILQNLMEQIDK